MINLYNHGCSIGENSKKKEKKNDLIKKISLSRQ
jgi:hypothetical protein